MNPPIRAVVFDFGGVLITPITTLLAEVAAWHDVSMVSMLDVLMGPRETSTSDHPWHRAERGELATSEMQREVVPFAEAAGLTLRGDEYQRVLSGEFTVHDAVIDRIVRLHDEGYLLGLAWLAARGQDALGRRGLVIEDSLAGVASAKAAGLACIGVAHTYSSSELLGAGADAATATLAEIDEALLSGLYQRLHG